MNTFKIESQFTPQGDQPQAIDALFNGIKQGFRDQTLLGVTGSGKTFTMAHVIQKLQKPTLVIAHNKTLAAQLCNEFRELFPKNAVHYFVSYYDYYQPEAYIPTSDTYIGKEALINDEIDKLRHGATTALLTRKDVIVVASVSCIYGLGAPEIYEQNILRLARGARIVRKDFMRKLVELQFSRTNADLRRGTFRVRGDNWEIMPPDREMIYSFSLMGDGKDKGVIQDVYEINPVEGFVLGKTPEKEEVIIAPAKHFITVSETRNKAVKAIREELRERLTYLEKHGKLLEAERLERRTKFDLTMLQEVGYCHGIENYSRHLSGRNEGEPPDTLLNYFPRTEDGTPDFFTIIDESHVTIPQLRGMYEGDASRKRTLIEYGFRLPSALDNRPLMCEEFEKRIGPVVYVSATGSFEKEKSSQVVQQIIRPTGLIDPKITIAPAKGQVQDLLKKIPKIIERKERVLVTTLTKLMAEDLARYLADMNIKVNYLHSDVKTLERIKIITDVRLGTFDVLVGVNLLREGLDLPEVSCVAIMDADREGFLRSETSLIQTMGRAARNVNGEVLIYADTITGSIKRAVDETNRRRELQIAYNKKHGIVPQTIKKSISNILPIEEILELEARPVPQSSPLLSRLIKEKEKEMKEAARMLDFELAGILRDEIKVLNKKFEDIKKKEGGSLEKK